MKKGLFCIMALLAILPSCKKEDSMLPGGSENEYVEGHTRVIGIKGTDTSSTKYISGNGREQTVGLLLVEDSKLRAELMQFIPLPGGMGQYVIRMTNKQPYEVILRWGWEGLTLDTGTPPPDDLPANAVLTFTFTGDALPGRIKVKADANGNGGSNSSTLILEITNTILPITYTNFTRKVNGDQVTVEWSTDAPGDVDTFMVLWTPTGEKKDEVCKYILASDPNKKKYSATYKATKKLK